MVLNDFLSTVRDDDNDQHEIIPLSLKLMEILKERFFNTHVPKKAKYMI